MLAHKLGLHTVVTHPVYYLTPEQAALQRTLAAIRLNQPLDRLPARGSCPAGRVFRGPGRDGDALPALPGRPGSHRGNRRALQVRPAAGRGAHADRPAAARADSRPIPAPEGRSRARSRLYGGITPAVRARLDHELEVIARMGFEPIFLIVEEILDFARQTGVPFSSRGSAASSLVAHCLGITSPDPLRLNLYFERFLNPARTTPPDIDTDLCSRRRDEVIQHVFETYGAERVAMVGTINRFRPRSALGDVAKAHGLATGSRCASWSNQLPYGFWARLRGR